MVNHQSPKTINTALTITYELVKPEHSLRKIIYQIGLKRCSLSLNVNDKVEAVYVINDLNGEQIEGTFYERELQRIQLPEEFRVENVLRKKKQGKKTLHLVKWLGWDNTFNSWVAEEDLRKL